MAMQELKGKKCRWIYFNGVDDKVLRYLKKNFKFHSLDIEDVASERQRPKIDIYKYYLFFVAVFPFYDSANFKVKGREVDVFVNEKILITVAKNPHPFLDHIFNRVRKSAKLRKMWLEKGPSFLFYKILEKLFRESHLAVDVVNRQINEVEEDVYENELKNVAKDLALIQRSVLTLRRILEPQRFTVDTLVNMKRDYIPSDMGIYFDNVHDYIEKTWVEVENQKYTIDGLHWTNESMLSQRTNRIITILTVISASLMPMTLLAGFYGMNLNQLPLAHNPVYVFTLFGLVAVLTIGLVVLIFRARKN